LSSAVFLHYNFSSPLFWSYPALSEILQVFCSEVDLNPIPAEFWVFPWTVGLDQPSWGQSKRKP